MATAELATRQPPRVRATAETLVEQPAFTHCIVIHTLGTAGGALGATTGRPLAKAFLAEQLSNGAGGPGQRGEIAARRVLADLTCADVRRT